MRLRDVARVDPPTEGFSRTDAGVTMTFLPLDRIWHDRRFDPSLTIEFDGDTKSYTPVVDGDVLVPKVAPTFAHGRVALAHGLVGNRALATSEVFVVRVDDRATARFLQHRLQGKDFLTEGVASWTGVAGLKRISSDYLRNVPISAAAWGARSAIADFLDAETTRIDALVAQRRRQALLLTARRASLMFAAVSGSLGPGTERRSSGVPWLSTLPDHWPELKLTRVTRLGSGHTPSRSRPQWWIDCTIPWITTGEVAQIRDDRREVLLDTRENISETGLANSAAELRPAGTVVLSRTASAGYSAIMGTDMATSQDFVTWTCSDRLLPRFLLFCLRAMRSDLLGRLAMGSTHRTIYFPDVESIRIPLPSVAEQQRMLDLGDEQLKVLAPLEATIERQITLLRERRQALITAAVTGRLQVPEASMANLAR